MLAVVVTPVGSRSHPGTPNAFRLEAEGSTMSAEFSEDQIGKRVVDQAGVEVGTVSDVRDGDLYVEVAADADRETLSNLRWDGAVNQEVHHLRSRFVSNVGDDVIRLRV